VLAAIEEERAAEQTEGRGLGIVDCDVHNTLRARSDLKRYLSRRWHSHFDQGSAHGGPQGGLTVGANQLPRGSAFSLDAVPASGQAGSDLDLFRMQLLDAQNVKKAILQPINDILGVARYGDFGLAVASAINDWLAAEWLARDPRLFGAITVPFEDGVLAVREIERMAANPRFVSVLVMNPTREPLGDPKYHPIYEAAAAFGLPVAVHVAGFGPTSTAAGAAAYHIEFHASYPQAYQAQVVSLVCSGIFDRIPSLQIVLEEAGIAWMPALMWRMDRAWRMMGDYGPPLTANPSEIIREHFWFTTQPIDEPERPEFLPKLLNSLGMNDRIMFSSDYPHWDRDDPKRVLLPSIVGSELREAILSRNALRLFRFEDV
jgi:uncharacterized protein